MRRIIIFLGLILIGVGCSAPQILEPTELDFHKVLESKGAAFDLYSKTNQYFAEKHLFAKHEITLKDDKNFIIVARSVSQFPNDDVLRFSYTIYSKDNKVKADFKVQDVYSMNPYFMGPRKPFKSESQDVRRIFESLVIDLDKYLNQKPREEW